MTDLDKQREPLASILEAQVIYGSDGHITNLGHEMFHMFTDMGFPPDMFLSELNKRMELSLLAKVYIVSVYQHDFLEHRRLSGIQEKNIEKLQRHNRDETKRLIDTGELGIY